jgi:hypothetical protein
VSTIERYVADLGAQLRLRPEAAEQFLAEVEDHLQTATDDSVAAGVGRVEAELDAVRRFGSAREIAFAANGGAIGSATRLAGALARFGAVGSLAMLLGTLLARLAARLTSTAAVFGLPADASPPRSSISHWLAVQPGAGDWRSAAALENADDSLLLRGGAAVLLMIGCGVAAFIASRRYTPARSPSTALVPALAFTAAAAALLLGALLGTTVGDWGRGQALCDASVALVAGAAYWTTFRHRARVARARSA